MKDSKQFSVRLTSEEIRKIQMESMFAGVTQQEFAERVFDYFLALPKDKRREILKEGK
jgi:hypothetical protein